MAERWRRGVVALGSIGVLALAAPMPADAQSTVMFKTSNGHTLTLPPVSALDSCAAIQDVMDQIDATNYRLGSPDSIQHPEDRQLLVYEDALSAQRYQKCQQREPQGFLSGVRLRVGQ